MESRYKIKYLPSFSKELYDIIYYITYNLCNKKAAERLLNNVEDAILERSLNPEQYEIYESKKTRKIKWYRIYIGNYTIFYTVRNNNIMEVARIIYMKRNLEELL